MLKYRLLFGSMMLVALGLILYCDSRLDQANLSGTWLQEWFLGRERLPRGLVLLPLFWGLIVLGGLELCRIFAAKDIHASRLMVISAGITGCTLIYIMPAEMNSQLVMAVFASILTGFMLATLVRYSLHARTQGAVAAAGVTMLSMVYMGLLPGFLLAIRRWHSVWVLAAVILVVKCCDIGAYFTGRAIGRHKLIPWLSPGKTWEGLAGGMALSALAATGLAAMSNHWDLGYVYTKAGAAAVHYNLVAAGVSGAVMGLLGQFGDLVASLFKRDAGIKDSASYIPGFGGVLDVVDSPIVVAPFAYWFLRIAETLGSTRAVP